MNTSGETPDFNHGMKASKKKICFFSKTFSYLCKES